MRAGLDATLTMLVEIDQKSSVLHRSEQQLILNSDSCETMVPLRASLNDLMPESKAGKDSCPATPSTRASSGDSLISSQTPEGQDDVAPVGGARPESKLPERQPVQAPMTKAPMTKADALSTKSDQEMQELIKLRDQLAGFRNDEDISEEAVKQTLFVIGELSKKNMTVKRLRKTGLGLECSKQFLLKHCSTEVSRASRELVARWKALAKTGPRGQTSTLKSLCARGAIESKRQIEPEIVGPEYLAMSVSDYEPQVEPECADHIKDQLKQKGTQIARLQASIKRRKSFVVNDDNIESENRITKHYEEVLHFLQKEAQELRHQVGEV
jgi:hypothetical protein